MHSARGGSPYSTEFPPVSKGSGPAPNSLMVRFQVRMKPDSCPVFSAAMGLPRTTLREVRIFPIPGNISLHDVELEGGASFGTETEDVASVFAPCETTMLESTPGRRLYRVGIPRCLLSDLFQRLGLIPNFPITTRGDTTSFTMTAPRPQLQEFFTTLKAEVHSISVATIARGRRADGVASLTPKQQEVFLFARAAGYWDRPRRISLSDMAFMLDVSKSTLSETLSTVERKIILAGDPYLEP